MPGRKWTEEQRRQQAQAIRRWKPWKKATGPKTDEGKATSARNTLQHGSESRIVRKLRRLEKEFRDTDNTDFTLFDRLEEVRLASAEFVAENVRKDDPQALLKTHKFLATQIHKAGKQLFQAYRSRRALGDDPETENI